VGTSNGRTVVDDRRDTDRRRCSNRSSNANAPGSGEAGARGWAPAACKAGLRGRAAGELASNALAPDAMVTSVRVILATNAKTPWTPRPAAPLPTPVRDCGGQLGGTVHPGQRIPRQSARGSERLGIQTSAPQAPQKRRPLRARGGSTTSQTRTPTTTVPGSWAAPGRLVLASLMRRQRSARSCVAQDNARRNAVRAWAATRLPPRRIDWSGAARR
jgi:hypothetical protein